MIPDKLILASIRAEKLVFGPRSVYIDINTDCNLSCNFCWIHSPLNRPGLHRHRAILPFKDIKRIITTSCTWGSNELVVSGDGEPTLHPDFKKIIRYAVARNLKISLTTNATFNRALLPTIAMIDNLYVTLSAADKELFGRVQSPDNPGIYHRIINNLKLISAIHRRRKKPFLNLAFIINSTNYQCIPNMLVLGNNININKLTFRIMEPTRYTRKLLLSGRQKKELLRIINSALKLKCSFMHNLKVIKDGIANYAISPYKLKSCYSGWYNLFVDFNKNVGLCCHNEKLIVGNIRDNPLQAIWQSPRAQRLRFLCKNNFTLAEHPFKNECEWCHWHEENRKIQEKLTATKYA